MISVETFQINFRFLQKNTRGSDKVEYRSGKTVRHYHKADSKHQKRDKTLIVASEGYEGVLPAGGPAISMDKNKRWELIDEAKDGGDDHLLLERQTRTQKTKVSEMNQKVEETRKKNQKALDGSSDDEEESSSEDPTGQYRFTKGGDTNRKGVMISKRRTPGKKGVKKHNNKKSGSEETDSGSGSEGDSDEAIDKTAKQVKVLAIETDSHAHNDMHRKRRKGCNCEYCNPHLNDTREGKKADMASQLRDL